DSPPHALRACALRAEERSRVEILGDDRSHAAGFDAPRADGGARTGERGLIGRHEGRRPRQAGQAHARESTAPHIVIRAAVAFIAPRLHILRQFHCFVSFLRSASHGFSGVAVSGLPKSSLVPSGSVTDVTPAAFACSTADAWLARLARLARLGQ